MLVYPTYALYIASTVKKESHSNPIRASFTFHGGEAPKSVRLWSPHHISMLFSPQLGGGESKGVGSSKFGGEVERKLPLSLYTHPMDESLPI